MYSTVFRKHLAILSGSTMLALAVGAACAADLRGVTIVHDQDVADRTNMQRPANETSKLGVTYDRDVAQRTNMPRQPADVSPVTVTQDQAVMERTNMGGIARGSHNNEPIQTGSSK
jgi:hypothetical protein